MGRNAVHKLIALALVMPLVPPVWGQPRSENLPESSPLWWTLTEEISPKDLRAARVDPQATRNRFRSSAMGRDRTPADQERVRAYVNGDESPQLVTVAEALFSLAVYFDPEHMNEHSTKRIALWYRDYGLSTEGGDALAAFMLGMNRAYDDHQSVVGDDLVKIAGLIREKEVSLGVEIGSSDLWQAFDANDFSTLSRELGVPAKELRHQLRHNYDPWDAYLRKELPRLRRDLSKQDWDAMRQLLYEIAAPMFTHVDIDGETGQ